MKYAPLFLLLPLTLGACLAPAPTVAPTAPVQTTATERASARLWWSNFQDRTLDRLIAKGLARNLDIETAVSQIRTAEANARLAGAADLPSLGLGAAATRASAQEGQFTNSTAVAFNTSWTLDLFGANRSARDAAAAEREAAYRSASVARVTVAGAIASAYIDLRYYQERIALTQRSIDSRRETLKLTQAKTDLGAVNRLASLQAEQAVAEAEATLPALEVGFAQALNRLATLTATPAAELGRDLTKGAPQPHPRYRAALGLPAEVIRNRPDVQAAERRYAAAMARVGVAEAAFYPSVTLGGTVTPTDLGGSSLTTWSFGPQINLPLFTGGANRARLSVAQEGAKQADIAWRGTVLAAAEEIGNALAGYERDGRNVAAQARRLKAAEETLSLSQESYDLGQADFLEVLDAERSVFVARGAMADAVRQRGLNYVRISVAAAEG
jgi:multidrug efflux system outer membrane protein